MNSKEYDNQTIMNLEKCKTYVMTKLKDGLDSIFQYHSYHHTLDVYDSAENIMNLMDFNGIDRVKILTACVLHDSGFLVSHIDHEYLSTLISSDVLPKFDYDEKDIDEINRMIMTTKLPQSPYDRHSSILCDADLDYLGRNDFFDIENLLREEWENLGKSFNDVQWYELQLKFLSDHHYHIEETCKLRQEGKTRNIEKVREILSSL